MSNIDEHTQAKQTMDNALGSLQNKMRAIFNYGYRSGYEQGKSDAKAEIIEYLNAFHDDILIVAPKKGEEE